MNAEDEIRAWIDRISVVRRDLSDLPACPFARAAWLHDAVVVWYHIEDSVGKSVMCAARMWRFHQRAALIVCLTPTTLEELTFGVETANSLMAKHIAFPDHPDMPVILPGDDTSLGRPCVIIQLREESDRARASLRRHGYYTHWSDEALSAVRAIR